MVNNAIEGYKKALKDGAFPMGKIKFIKRQIFSSDHSTKKDYRYKK